MMKAVTSVLVKWVVVYWLFDLRIATIESAFMVRANGEREGNYMKKKSKNVDKFGDMPVGNLTRVPDFLPPPEELIAADTMVKVTLSIDRSSLEFFKAMANKLGAKYQKMMREVLRGYAQQYSESNKK